VPTENPALSAAVQAHLAREIGAPVTVAALSLLGGGACQENFALDVDLPAEAKELAGKRKLVMRADARRSLEGSIDRKAECAVVRAAAAAGVKTPDARWFGEGITRPGAGAYFLDWMPGVAIGRRVVRDKELATARRGLATELAAELAKIHTITPASPSPPLSIAPDFDPIRSALEFARAAFEKLDEPRPGLALALAWLEAHLPSDRSVVLVHGDFRTGNFLVTERGLSAILDWEFAHWGCPAEDVAWICLRTWRFGENRLGAGGFAKRSDFIAAYAAASGREVSRADVHFWEVLGNVRWAAGCVQQGERYLSGAEKDLELVAIPRRAVEMEYEALRLVEMGPA
jgi:aminoglycoside phosphotransferase (APT) family kinase protein